VLLRRGGGGDGGRPSRESWQWPRYWGRHPGIVGVVVKLGMLVEVSRLRVDVVKGAADVLICMIVAVESTDIEAVDNPREAGALANGAVESKSLGAASARRGIERDGLVVAEPHREVGNCRFLLLQLGHNIPAAGDERVGLVGQVAQWGGRPLLRRFPGSLVHGRWQSEAIAVLWRQ
jgi:hypothetical protein